MTFTPGSDGGRTDTYEAQVKGLSNQPTTEEEFEEAQSGLKDLGEAFYQTGRGLLFLLSGGNLSAVQSLDALRARIEGKTGPIPIPNPNNLGGLVTLEPLTTTEEAFTRSDVTGTESELITEQSSVSPSILEMFGGTATPEQKNILNSLVLKMKGDDTGDMSDEELNELYKKRNNPDFYVTDIADPNYGRFIPDLEEEAKIKSQKGGADPTGIRSEQIFGNRSYWENLPKRSQSLFTKAGLTENDAIFFLSNFDKITRDTAAAIQDPDYTSGTFELMKKELLPGFLEEMKGVKGLRPQLDHINQLVAALPLYDGTTFKEREQINKIVLGEGIYAGHSPGNLQYLDLRVHTVKSNYFNDLVGKDGMKFFGTKDLSTFEGKVKAAQEYAAIVKNSYKIVEDANKANLALYKQNLSPEEVTSLLFEINPYTKYTIRDLKRIIEELKGVTQARSEANALDLMLTVAEGMTPAEFFKMTGSGPRGQRKLPSIDKLKSAAFDDKFYQPLLDESFNYLK